MFFCVVSPRHPHLHISRKIFFLGYDTHTKSTFSLFFKRSLEWQAQMEASKEGNRSWPLTTLSCRKTDSGAISLSVKVTGRVWRAYQYHCIWFCAWECSLPFTLGFSLCLSFWISGIELKQVDFIFFFFFN